MKFLKILGIGLLSITMILFSIYYGFKISEHIKGNDYVDYLSENSESVKLNDNFSFDIATEDIKNKSLILVGEIHGFKEPTKFDVEFYSYLRSQFDVKDYIIEMDYSQAYYLNQFNQSGDQSLLKRVLENWVVNQGKENKDYFDRFVNLQKLYQKQPFKYYGNNNISDVELLTQHINELASNQLVTFDSEKCDSINLVQIKNVLESLLSKTNNIPDTESLNWTYQHLLENVNYFLKDESREEVLTNNFLAIYDHFKLKEDKVYGYFGLGHTVLEELDGGYQSMAKRLKVRDDWFEDQIMSLNFLFCDSHMVIKSRSLPSFLADEGQYTKFPVSFDNIWFNYLVGVKDLKRTTEKGTKTLFKLDGNNSPYLNSTRLFKMFQILPFGSLMNAKEGSNSADYSQYLVFIRNSDWAEPF